MGKENPPGSGMYWYDHISTSRNDLFAGATSNEVASVREEVRSEAKKVQVSLAMWDCEGGKRELKGLLACHCKCSLQAEFNEHSLRGLLAQLQRSVEIGAKLSRRDGMEGETGVIDGNGDGGGLGWDYGESNGVATCGSRVEACSLSVLPERGSFSLEWLASSLGDSIEKAAKKQERGAVRPVVWCQLATSDTHVWCTCVVRALMRVNVCV